MSASSPTYSPKRERWVWGDNIEKVESDNEPTTINPEKRKVNKNKERKKRKCTRKTEMKSEKKTENWRA